MENNRNIIMTIAILVFLCLVVLLDVSYFGIGRKLKQEYDEYEYEEYLNNMERNEELLYKYLDLNPNKPTNKETTWEERVQKRIDENTVEGETTWEERVQKRLDAIAAEGEPTWEENFWKGLKY